MRGRRYTAPPLTSTCSVVCQSYKETISKRKEIRKRKVDHGFHNPMGAFRRKAEYKYEIKCECIMTIKHEKAPWLAGCLL